MQGHVDDFPDRQTIADLKAFASLIVLFWKLVLRAVDTEASLTAELLCSSCATGGLIGSDI